MPIFFLLELFVGTRSDQPAGKNSVLEGITGLPFHRQDGL